MSTALEHIVIDAGVSGPTVLITAGVHGDEYEPMLAVTKLTQALQNKLVCGKVVLVPVVNKSAYNEGSRVGADGLDLARACPGNINGTVTEKYAAEISELIRQADYYIDLHTGGKLFDIYPLAGYMLHPSDRVLKQQQRMAEAFNLPVIWGTDPYLDGRTLSIARDANIPAIYVEYGGGQLINKEITEAYINGCINIIIQLKMMNRPVENASIKYWVEDYRRNQGHLQSKTPAPASGVFIPSVKLGDHIKAEQPWGAVYDIVTQKQVNVYAESEGMVLFLRVAPYVQKGESLGGILPVNRSGKTIIR
jgi:predicted deacylase